MSMTHSPNVAGFSSGSVSQRIAFLILAHDDPIQLRRLCRALNEFTVFVHIDVKSQNFSGFDRPEFRHVHILERRFSTYWGDFSVVEATLELLRTALTASTRFDRFMLLSGTCYPVKPLGALADVFSERPTTEFIQLTRIGAPGTHLRNVISRHWRMKPFLPASMKSAAFVSKTDHHARRLWNKLSSYLPRKIEEEIEGLKPFFW